MEFMYICFNLFLLFSIISVVLGDTENCDDHTVDSLRLTCELTKDYDPSLRPVKSFTDTIYVDLEMLPIDINFNDHDDKFSLSTWMLMNWTDVFLKWNPDDYNNLKELQIDCSEIWRPDLISFSTLAEDPYQSGSHEVCKVNSTGFVSLVFATSYKTYCVADRTYWPYDQHTCVLYLGSRNFIGSSMNFTLKEVLPDNLKKDKEWDLKNLKPIVNIYKGGVNDSEIYTRLAFKFLLRRHASVLSATYVFPGIGMSLIILAALWLDIISPERIYMLALIIYDEVMFLEFFGYFFPTSGIKTPLLVSFLRDSITISGICIISTIISRQLIELSIKPSWLTAFVRLLNEKSFIPNYLLINMESENSEMKETEDATPSSFSLASQKQKEWKIFVQLLDRVMFIVVLINFFIFAVKYLPAMY